MALIGEILVTSREGTNKAIVQTRKVVRFMIMIIHKFNCIGTCEM